MIIKKIFYILFIAVTLFPSQLIGQSDTASSATTAKGSAVVFEKDTLFFIYSSLGPFSSDFRAEQASQKLSELISDENTVVDSIQIVQDGEYRHIDYGSKRLFTISADDSKLAGISVDELAERAISSIKNMHFNTHYSFSWQDILIKLGIILGILIVAFFLFYLIKKLFTKIYELVENWEGKFWRSLVIKSQEILSAESVTMLVLSVFKIIRLGVSLIVIYYALTNIFKLLPWTKDWDIAPILWGVMWTILVTTIALALIQGLNSLYKLSLRKVAEWKGTIIKGVSVKKVEVLSTDRVADLVVLLLKAVKITLYIIILYFFITIVFSFFTFTRTWATTLIGYVVNPLNSLITSIISYLPSLFFIVVIIIFTRYLIKIVKFFFDELEKGTLTLPGFHKDWAMPTFKIVRFLIIVLAVIIIYPYLPGSDSRAFEGVSILLGLVLSLASASAIANMIAGLVLTYMNAFRLGDRVKIADTTGDVIEKTLLATRIRTIKNVDITIPNAMVLSSHIINFSSSAQDKGLILHTTVTIGYDAPWQKVHQLLIDAALESQYINKEPKPFILQTSLDDFYVSYELNAYTSEPGIMAKIYSEIHSNIQNKFNEAGVEIMSPHYGAVRDGNQVTIPENYLPKSYQAPSFRVFPFWGDKDKPKS
ncbi:MAG: mechanosensitive ion channel [Bacteroidetes bacterium]|nr:mechanosensitive ion channel [Bacteroidota bacterium]